MLVPFFYLAPCRLCKEEEEEGRGVDAGEGLFGALPGLLGGAWSITGGWQQRQGVSRGLGRGVCAVFTVGSLESTDGSRRRDGQATEQ